MNTLNDLQDRINKTYYQKFTITKEKTLIPDGLSAHKLKFMEETFLNQLAGKRLLDIGCSFGFFCVEAKRRGAREVIGIDWPESIAIARDVAGYLNLDIQYRDERFSEDILKLGTFDVILLCSVYHYIFSSLPDHSKIFNILSKLQGDIFFENPMDTQDHSCQEFFNKHAPELAPMYTPALILDAINRHYKTIYLGNHLHAFRSIYWLEKKNDRAN